MWISSDEQQMFAFWKARLDDDERVARKAGCQRGGGTWTAEADAEHLVAVTGQADPGESYIPVVLHPDDDETSFHVARHDPARVLRDVAASRARMDRLEEAIGAGHDSYDLASALLPLEIAAYDNHQDYKDAWRP